THGTAPPPPPASGQLHLFATAATGAVITRPARIPADAAPFDQAVADRVPRYGAKGVKTTGILVLSDGRVLPPQDNGANGPAHTQTPARHGRQPGHPRRGPLGRVHAGA